jgi:thiamine transport system permease protein
MFVILPLLGLLISAINPSTIKTLLHDNTMRASLNTVLIACCAALLALGMGIGILLSTRHLRIRRGKTRIGNSIQLLGNIILVMPPVVLGTGLFLLLRAYADVFSLALILATIINSLMALPFVLRILDGPLIQAAEHNDKLIQSLGITGWSRWRLLDWPLIRKPIGFALAISATLAAGDLSAIALFGSERAMTLPLLLFQRMGSYRLYEAAVTAAILLIVCLALFVFFQKLIGGHKHAEA